LQQGDGFGGPASVEELVMGKPLGKPRVKRGKRAASSTGGKRRAQFQPWRTSGGKGAAVTVRSIETGEVLRVENPAAERDKARAARRRQGAERAQRARAHAELNRDWDAAIERDE
jgi:hypothetical protein